MSDNIPQPQRRRWYKRWWFWVFLIGILGITGGTAIGQRMIAAQELASYEYLNDTVSVQTRTIQKTISTTGTITPDAEVSLYPQGVGTVTAVEVTVGQTVAKGDTLVTIDQSVGGTKNITATFDGRVTQVQTFVGDTVSAAIPVVTLAYNTTHIEFYASDAEAIALKPDQKVAISVPSYENGKTTYTAQVTFVDVRKTILTVTSQSSNSGFRVKVSTGDIPSHLTSIIGLTVDMTIITAEKSDVLAIENAAVQYNDDSSAFVYLPVTVDRAFVEKARGLEDVTSVLEKKNITVGFEGDEYTEVIRGLNAGESVLFYVPSQGSASPF